MTLEQHPDRRIEAALRAAEKYADVHRDEQGVTNREGGMMLHLVSIVMQQAEKLEGVDGVFQQLHFACDNPDHASAYADLARALRYAQ